MIDLVKIPFSRFGSYLVVSKDNDRLFIRDVRGGDLSSGRLVELSFFDVENNKLNMKLESEETLLRFSNDESKVEICFDSEDTVRVRGNNCIVRLDYVLKSYDHLNQHSINKFELHSYSEEVKVMTTVLKGDSKVNLEWDKTKTKSGTLTVSNNFEIAFSSYVDINKCDYDLSFDEIVKREKQFYNKWAAKTLNNENDKFIYSQKLATYITFSSVVKPEGLLKKYSMYMSNNWMTNIWSWDNCFNGLALASNQPELGFDQLMVFADYQLESGVLPDFMNNRSVSYSCAKPPIYGWAYTLMMELNDYYKEKKQIEPIYKMMKKQIEYWENHRTNKFGLPFYNHGNDSGMDNSTIFNKGCPVVSPDLLSYMILQYEALEKLANFLEISNQWLEKADRLQEKLINELYDGREFFSRDGMTNKRIESNSSLITLMPITIGHRLERDVLDNIINKLTSDDYYTEFGFATESINSEYYLSNGYWRGPIWAPTMLLIIDGLKRSGYKDVAIQAARRFCNATLVGGMAENFDAKTAQGLVDPAFTWTSSTYLILSNFFYN